MKSGIVKGLENQLSGVANKELLTCMDSLERELRIQGLKDLQTIHSVTELAPAHCQVPAICWSVKHSDICCAEVKTGNLLRLFGT